MRDIADFFKVLADESRLQLLWLLSNYKELCVCDLVEALRITQSKASRHLTTLRHAGLVKDRKQGAWSYYSLCPIADDFKRRQLESLLAGMPGQTAAAEALGNLHDWLEDSARGKACHEGGGIKPNKNTGGCGCSSRE